MAGARAEPLGCITIGIGIGDGLDMCIGICELWY